MRRLLLALPLFSVLGCPADPEPGPDPAPVVVPLYADAGAWSDRVLDDGTSLLDASGAPCACEPQQSACIHAGPLRAMAVPALEDCDGVEAVDTAGALDWTCLDDALPVRIVSRGLADGAGLASLLDLDVPAWKGLQLVVSVDGAELLRSEAAAWWDDPVVALPSGDGLLVLEEAGTIYVQATARATAGIQIDADRVSLVAGGPLIWSEGAPDNCLGGTGEDEGADATCLVAAGGQSCLWIEGAFEGGTAGLSVYLSDVHLSALWGIDVQGGGDGVRLAEGSSGDLVHAAAIEGVAQDALVLDGAERNTVQGLRSYLAGWSGVALFGSSGNTFVDAYCEGGASGWYLVDSDDNLLHRVGALDNNGGSFWLDSSDGNALHEVESAGNGAPGCYLTTGSDHNVLDGVRSSGDSDAGILVEDGLGNRVFGSRVAASNGYGIAIWDTWDTAIVESAISGTALDALWGDATVDVTVVDVLAAGSGADGVHFSDGTRGLTIVGVTSVDNADDGLELHNTEEGETLGCFLVNAVAAGNGQNGLNLDESTGLRVVDLDVFASGDHGIEIEEMADVSFSGLLRIGSSGGLDCLVEDGDGLVHETCAPSGASDAVVETGLDLGESFTGPVASDDVVNDDDESGTAGGAGIRDWLGFESRYRVWARDGEWPDPASLAGPCGTAATCRIRDWRVETSDDVLREIHGHAASGEDCPASVAGDVAATDFHSTPNTFLLHAFETVLDGVGDEDGLCESGESCIYSPNRGAYQGEGSPEACAFATGLVSDVEMLAFHANGAT